MAAGVNDVKLYSDEEEKTSTLNFKRGIISALLVPLVEEDKNKEMVCLLHKKSYAESNQRIYSAQIYKGNTDVLCLIQPTIYGQCKSQSTVNEKQTIATDITVSRDLSSCDKFVPMRDQTSSLALISGMVRCPTHYMLGCMTFVHS